MNNINKIWTLILTKNRPIMPCLNIYKSQLISMFSITNSFLSIFILLNWILLYLNFLLMTINFEIFILNFSIIWLHYEIMIIYLVTILHILIFS